MQGVLTTIMHGMCLIKCLKKVLCYLEGCDKWFTYYSNAQDLFLEIIIVELGLNICFTFYV